MVARGMMLELHRNGHITLPVKRRNPYNPLKNRKAPEKIDIEQILLETKSLTIFQIFIVNIGESNF